MAIAFALLEGVLQIVFCIGWDAEQKNKTISPLIQTIYWTLKPHTSWEEYFVINHANGANLVYGTLHQPHPDLVIAAFIDDDLNRAMLPFRDYKKPRFILAHNTLQLTNTPIGDTQQTLNEVATKRYYS